MVITVGRHCGSNLESENLSQHPQSDHLVHCQTTASDYSQEIEFVREDWYFHLFLQRLIDDDLTGLLALLKSSSVQDLQAHFSQSYRPPERNLLLRWCHPFRLSML